MPFLLPISFKLEQKTTAAILPLFTHFSARTWVAAVVSPHCCWQHPEGIGMKCSDSWSKALGKPLVEDLGPPDFEWLRRSYSLFSSIFRAINWGYPIHFLDRRSRQRAGCMDCLLPGCSLILAKSNWVISALTVGASAIAATFIHGSQPFWCGILRSFPNFFVHKKHFVKQDGELLTSLCSEWYHHFWTTPPRLLESQIWCLDPTFSA